MRKPKVDLDLCTGDQVCVIIAPYVFNMNEEGKAYVVDPKGADEETIQHAIDQCPSQARAELLAGIQKRKAGEKVEILILRGTSQWIVEAVLERTP